MSDTAENRWHDLHDPLGRAAERLGQALIFLPEAFGVHSELGRLVGRMRYVARATDLTFDERVERLAQLVSPLDAEALASVGITREDLSPVHDPQLLACLAHAASVVQALGHAQASITGAMVMLTTGRGPREPLDVHATIDDVLNMWDPVIISEGGRVRRDLAATRTTIRGNNAALARVWSNFIDNALRASTNAARRVRITVSTHNTPESIVVEVVDDGPGIPADLLPRIFDPDVSTRPGGGQGLDYVRRTITDHGGTVSVTSEPGTTRFAVRLPLA